MWLPPLADRFVRLILQLLARYATWLQAGMAARSAAASAAQAAGGAQPPQVHLLSSRDNVHTFPEVASHNASQRPFSSSTCRHGQQCSRGLHGMKQGMPEGRVASLWMYDRSILRNTQESTDSGSAWAVGARADALCTLRADTDAVLAWTCGGFWAELSALLQGLPPEARLQGPFHIRCMGEGEDQILHNPLPCCLRRRWRLCTVPSAAHAMTWLQRQRTPARPSRRYPLLPASLEQQQQATC